MSLDTPTSDLLNTESESPTSSPEVDPNLQVRFKREEGQLLLFLPPEIKQEDSEANLNHTWTELWQQLKHRLNGGEHTEQPHTDVYLMAENRLLDVRQLQDIAEALNEVQLQLKRVKTSRRQTAVAAAMAGYSVDQDAERETLTQPVLEPSISPLVEPLYLKMTVRSGVDIRHPGTIVIVGDVNPGSSVVADGDIIIWGRLRGNAHAGAKGNPKSIIMALQMEPKLIRIADQVARGPETSPEQFYPEVAYINANGIRISPAKEVAKARVLTLDN
ncbi:putative septum site-determining protein MinC [Planktothrix serta PCC 8927]|uniref:Probable septum site-determining protein MinC n=1 Tax=Planktothrix serta PCC 8927 TaxID=671068 RepID=A0A7Z9E4J4_9CYAN|nr:septum site-determining protein MinC [Planktothrix serta]VXD25098.1 putative septum site-determining protein MinC [Planktothrix serta PCC 8927]